MLHKNRVKNRNHMTSFQVIIISFFCLILVGTLLLMLPVSSRQRCVTSFPDAMFTAVSATCVTGLVVKDTASKGYCYILVSVRTGGHFDADTDRRYGRYHHRFSYYQSIRQEDRSVAAQYNAGIHLRTAGWRYREADRIYP